MSSAIVDSTAIVAEGVVLGYNVVVGPRARIGANTYIGHGAIIDADTVIGEECYIHANAVLGRPPRGVGSMSRPPRTDLVPLELGRRCVVGAGAVLYRGTIFGNECLLGDLASVREECRIGSRVIIGRGVTVNYQTSIADGVKIMDNTHITGNMVIEEGVFIGVLVGTANDNSMDRAHGAAEHMAGPRILKGAAIGSGATLLPGITIGEYAVVGAGSVVNRDTPPKVIVAGVPARVVQAVPPEWLPPSEHA